MDAWTHSQVIAMLEGGTEQLQQFFTRHGMDNSTEAFHHRYQTRAAKFYRQNMERHVQTICQLRIYGGRAASRKIATTGVSNRNENKNDNKTQASSHRLCTSTRQQIPVC
jgi:hypothetical protein